MLQVEQVLTLHDIEISLITLHWFLTLFARHGFSTLNSTKILCHCLYELFLPAERPVTFNQSFLVARSHARVPQDETLKNRTMFSEAIGLNREIKRNFA